MSTLELSPTDHSTRPAPATRPELLAPAGDRTCLVAAIENGADAVYFGLQGHNARARATNFDANGLDDTMATLHRRGVKGYVALNTLVFPAELDDVEAVVRRVAGAGVDAVIVQDLGLARLIRATCPDLEIHASTQMSITSAEGARLAEELGCTRVILARELSIGEIARVREASNLPVEVFVHGALCVAYSGQCLTSEALGGRSANRGECAQACRMPYQIVSDGALQPLDSVQYLLSPQDLAAYDLIPELIRLGVSSLKIEGRLKTAEYVANITRHYRRAIDDAVAGRPASIGPDDVREMELSFSRGFSHGFLDGNNHKVLVRGDHAKKRGVFLGRIEAVSGGKVRLNLAAPVKKGDGLVFDGDESAGVPEQGGRVYEVDRPRQGRQPATPAPDAGLSAGPAELGFGRRDLDTTGLRVGQRVWKTDDPELTRRLRRTFEGPPPSRTAMAPTPNMAIRFRSARSQAASTPTRALPRSIYRSSATRMVSNSSTCSRSRRLRGTSRTRRPAAISPGPAAGGWRSFRTSSSPVILPGRSGRRRSPNCSRRSGRRSSRRTTRATRDISTRGRILRTGQRTAPRPASPSPSRRTSSTFTVPGSQGGNPNLKNEIANSWTAGVQIRPRFASRLALNANWINISLKQAIVSLSATDVLNGCYDFGELPGADVLRASPAPTGRSHSDPDRQSQRRRV